MTVQHIRIIRNTSRGRVVAGRSYNIERSYLLIFGSGAENIIHEHREEFSYSSDTSGEGAIRATTSCGLSRFLGLVYPGSSHRVYNIEYSQLVCAWCLLEVSVNLLDQDRFGLSIVSVVGPQVDGTAYLNIRCTE